MEYTSYRAQLTVIDCRSLSFLSLFCVLRLISSMSRLTEIVVVVVVATHSRVKLAIPIGRYWMFVEGWVHSNDCDIVVVVVVVVEFVLPAVAVVPVERPRYFVLHAPSKGAGVWWFAIVSYLDCPVTGRVWKEYFAAVDFVVVVDFVVEVKS